MAFSDYKNLAQVQEEFQIKYQEFDFVERLQIELPTSFCAELNFNLTAMDAFSSDAARCELVIFPVLREIYKQYFTEAALWVQKTLSVDAKLTGAPDYMLSRKSDLGKNVLDYLCYCWWKQNAMILSKAGGNVWQS